MEGPWVFPANGSLYLFYSGNMYDSDSDGTCLYSIGVARSSSLYSPFTKLPYPILSTQKTPAKLTGPGHCSVLQTEGSSL